MILGKRLINRAVTKHKEFAALLLSGICYFVLQKLGFYLSEFTGNLIQFWPASGLALAGIVLLYRYPVAIGAGLGSFGYHLISLYSVEPAWQSAVIAASVIAGGTFISMIFAAFLINRCFSERAPETLREVAVFMVITAVTGSISAISGILGLNTAHNSYFSRDLAAGITWWLGDTAGLLIATPLALVWSRKRYRKSLVFPVIAPCAGLSLIGFFAALQLDYRFLTLNTNLAHNYSFNTWHHSDDSSITWAFWVILLIGIALNLILGLYLENHRREQALLRASEKRLKRQNFALAHITRNESISSGNLSASLQILTETSAATLYIDRVSIWLFNEDKTAIYCADLYELSTNTHSSGEELTTIDYPSYFQALMDARNLAVNEVDTDPITQELQQHYLPKHNITALLDAPIHFGNDFAGVVCHEHVGAKRTWTQDEQIFAGSIADLAALAIEVKKRQAAETALRAINIDLESKVKVRTDELSALNANLAAEITERKQAEAILRESELRLRLAIKAADIGVWDWNYQDNSVIYSTEWKRQLGYADNEIANHYLEWENRLHPDDKERAIAANLIYIEGKKSEYETDFRLRHKDGSYRWIHSRGEVVARNAEGKVTRIMGCHTDITRLKQSEEKLRVFRWFAESAGQGMLMAHLNGEIVYKNPMLIKTLEQLGLTINQHNLLSAYYSETSENKLKAEILPKLLDEGQWTGELEFGRGLETPVPTLDNFFAVRNEDGQPQYIAAIITDISQQKAIEQQLTIAKEAAESADRAKSMFIASMSHELRTPLNAIIGFTGILLQGLSGSLNERQNDQLSRVFRSAKHLLGLITDIIDLSKVEANRMDVFPETLILEELIAQACETVKAQAREKDLIMETIIPPGLQIFTDRKRLIQCIINLLSNAVKYTEQGKITLTVVPDATSITIQVEDTGIGIGPEQLERLFKPFERLESNLRITTPGTGLGLYLTQKIAKDLLGGCVDVDSELGHGSRFRLRIARHLIKPDPAG